MKIIDISLPISPHIPIWPGNPVVVIKRISSMDAGDHDNVSQMDLGVHTGTHVDAPNHFLNDSRTVETLKLDDLIGPAWVVEIPEDADFVSATVLEGVVIPEGTIRLLLKTRNSRHWDNGDETFDEHFVGVTADGAEWLVNKGMKLVGIDYLSIAPYKQGAPTHQILLKPGIVIIEGLDLHQVDPGDYTLYCLPLKLVGSDGAPARVVLVKE